ncbi:retron St85 family effector protein [Pseudomonas parafulva]|nr:retron St85 family effector protein [Pseudomonas parafulva]
MDPRQEPRQILADLDLEQCKVQFSKKPIVLLCGGHVPEKAHADAPDPEIRSLRDAITRKALAAYPSPHLFRPEEIKSWHEDGVFKNLMDFETDLSSICSLVAIAVESAGSIAELGAFSQLPDLSKKLIVFVPEEYSEVSSFINLGILRYIKESHRSGVKVYPWSPNHPRDIPEHLAGDALEDISAELNDLPKSQSFDLSNNVHLMVLIYELIRLYVAIKESEILDALKFFGRELQREDIRRKLFLLQQFSLVQKITYSDSMFYACGNETFHNLRVVLKSGASFDPLRRHVECVEYYKNNNSERNRNRAIERAKLGEPK